MSYESGNCENVLQIGELRPSNRGILTDKNAWRRRAVGGHLDERARSVLEEEEHAVALHLPWESDDLRGGAVLIRRGGAGRVQVRESVSQSDSSRFLLRSGKELLV